MVTAAVRYKETPADVTSWNFSSACGRIHLDPDLRTLLGISYRELDLSIPVRMDDGTLRVFRGSRLLHSNSRGPAVGTIKVAPGADADLAFALASSFTWTAATVNVPFGGACGVIDCDAASLAPREYETLLRRYASRSHVVLGPYQDVVIASSSADAALLLEEYSSLRGFTPACVAGKDAEQGGAAHIEKAKPRAAALALRETATRLGRELQNLRVAICATPQNAMDFLAEFISIGCTVVAVSDGRTTSHDERGLNALAIAESQRQHGTVSAITNSADYAINTGCDVLVMAAAECSLHAMNASRVRAPIVIEAAPLNITPSADVVLRQQRATVVPDLVAASGAIIAAHSEWAANLEHKQLHTRDIEGDLEKSIPAAVDAIFERCKKDRSTLRNAAYCIAVNRVAKTERLRGI